MKCIVAAFFLLSTTPRIAATQQAIVANSVSRMLADAARFGNAGQTGAARTLVDSLMKLVPPDSRELDGILFLRASLAPSVLDATFDYEKIIADPSSERRKESLLRVAQRALIAGELAKALDYLRSLARDYPDDSTLAVASYWKAVVLLESHDVTGACDANRDARAHARATSPAMIVALDTQSTASCPRISTVITSSPTKLYSVQVSAFGRRGDAEAMAARLTKGGLDAHVDGTASPFRVRIGHYATYAEAATELRQLRARKMTGFVTELDQ